MKGLVKIHNRTKFHFHSICDSQVINFQKFSWRWSSHELGHFGGVLGPTSPKNAPILIKFAPEVDLKERNTVLKVFWEIPIFTEITPFQNFNFFWNLAQLWGPFTPWRRPKSENQNGSMGKGSGIGLSENRKIKTVSLLPFKWKIGLLFALFWSFLGKKKGVVHC